MSNSKIQRWYRSYRHFFFTRGNRLVIAGLVPLTGRIFAPGNSKAAKACVWILGFDIALVFCLTGLYLAFIGISVFYQRKKTTAASAIFGLMIGLIAGGFLAITAIIAFIKVIR